MEGQGEQGEKEKRHDLFANYEMLAFELVDGPSLLAPINCICGMNIKEGKKII